MTKISHFIYKAFSILDNISSATCSGVPVIQIHLTSPFLWDELPISRVLLLSGHVSFAHSEISQRPARNRPATSLHQFDCGRIREPIPAPDWTDNSAGVAISRVCCRPPPSSRSISHRSTAIQVDSRYGVGKRHLQMGRDRDPDLGREAIEGFHSGQNQIVAQSAGSPVKVSAPRYLDRIPLRRHE